VARVWGKMRERREKKSKADKYQTLAHANKYKALTTSKKTSK